MDILIFLFFVYSSGVVITLDLITLIENLKITEYSKKETIKLLLGSWISCFVLRDFLINND